MKPKPRTRTASQQRDYEALCEVVRAKLLELGDFGHLLLRREREHVVIDKPAPPDAPDDRHPVLRLTPIGGFRFGLSFARHTGRWEKIPVSGYLADVLAQAVAMFAPWLEPEPIIRDNSGMDF